MNTERLLALADHLEGLDQSAFNMCEYWKEAPPARLSFFERIAAPLAKHFAIFNRPTCGTPSCIAGHAVALFGTHRGLVSAGQYRTQATKFYAADLLDFTWNDLMTEDGHARHLFFPPTQDRAEWEKITPMQAAQTIRRLVETGEVQWFPPLEGRQTDD